MYKVTVYTDLKTKPTTYTTESLAEAKAISAELSVRGYYVAIDTDISLPRFLI